MIRFASFAFCEVMRRGGCVICKGEIGFEEKAARDRKLCVGYFDPIPRKIRKYSAAVSFGTEAKYGTEYLEYFV